MSLTYSKICNTGWSEIFNWTEPARTFICKHVTVVLPCKYSLYGLWTTRKFSISNFKFIMEYYRFALSFRA